MQENNQMSEQNQILQVNEKSLLVIVYSLTDERSWIERKDRNSGQNCKMRSEVIKRSWQNNPGDKTTMYVYSQRESLKF